MEYIAGATLKGEYTSAKIFTDKVEETALEQIKELCDQPFMEGSKIRVMPDVHAGKGCTIGTTITLNGKVTPNLVGVDIGCGVLTVKLDEKFMNFIELDKLIREKVPHGQEVHETPISQYVAISKKRDDFKANHILNKERYAQSIGTLGGGNHFIEVSKDEDRYLYLTIHTGSRYVGAKIAQHYQKRAISELKKLDVDKIIKQLKAEGRHSEISEAIKKAKAEVPTVKNDLAYLEGAGYDDYLHDMKLAQQYARANRYMIAHIIIQGMNLRTIETFDTIHNYIDVENGILRKGAVSAQKGEKLIIPINMRDGSIIAVGKGNPDWNYSAPHGAGRVLSRRKAHQNLNMSEFKETMKDVWSTSVTEETLDEAPMAYKNMDDILHYIHETVNVIKVIKPIYNFKASEGEKHYYGKKR